MRRNMSDLFCGRIAAGEKYNLTCDNYYKYPVCEEFLESVDYVETTEETKEYMGL